MCGEKYTIDYIDKRLELRADAHCHLGIQGPWLTDDEDTSAFMRPKEFIENMDKHNVEKAVVFAKRYPGWKYPEQNDYIISAVQKYPDRLIGFARIDPRYGTEMIPEIERTSKEGLVGLKVHPVWESFCPDHSFFLPLYEAIAKSGMRFIISHSTASELGLATRWAAVASRFPELTIILAHLNEACLPLLKEFSNIYVDTSWNVTTQLVEQACEINSSKVLFGSDTPSTRWETQLAVVTEARCSMEVKEQVLYKNFMELFVRR